ncbi:YraN family protein [Saccharothrix variisporea]|uniref:UPF0102 protein DFJ66_6350 n=1 Tax=Saccharothrix variisporea TaxID=543527 RepID=A0A495XJN0_9PSEU|nr:YraN family protein [Saccharothrix variisporea]RKT73024.1 putative endonuclease [Saccharothrix variisporea]
MDTQELGRRGEDLACRYLEEHQRLVILARNWRCKAGELDVVATDREQLVVCEVKCRSGTDHDHPLEAVTPEKLGRIGDLARRWLRGHGLGWMRIRFDLIGIHWPPSGPVRLHHVRGA